MALPPPDPGTTCLITGASSGIGAEIARGLAARGLGVTLVARREERLVELAEEIATAYGVEAEVVTGDVSKERSRKALINEIDKRGLTVEVLVNNAGFGSGGRFTTLDAGKVAEDAIKALESGDRVTVPGAGNQVAALWGQHLPRSVLLPLVKRIWPVS